MKKRFYKMCSVMTLSAMLTVSMTTYAAESDTREAGFQAETETETETAEKETEKTEEVIAEENELESLLIVREKENDAFTVRQMTTEELKEAIEEDDTPELAAVIFQLKKEVPEEETEAEESTVAESEAAEAGFIQEETEYETESETEMEQKGESADLEKEYPIVTLTDVQKEIVYEVAELVPQTVVLMNQCVLEDDLLFQEFKQVKAVTVLDAEDEEALCQAVETYDLEKEYAAYLEKIQKEKETSQALKGAARTTSLSSQTSGNNSLSAFPGISGQTESETETESETPSNRQARSSTSSTADTDSSTSTTNTTQKDVTITFVPDDVYEGDDAVAATYEVSSLTEITTGKVTITYDSSVMVYDEADVESDALEGWMVSVKSPNDTGGTEGKIEIEFSSNTPKKLEGPMVYLWFDLKNSATKGQQFNISLTVDKMMNGSQNLTSEVKTATMIAQVDPDAEEEEEETETTPATQAPTTETPSTTAPVNAPKTGDHTNIPMIILVMMCSAAVFIKARKRA